MRYVSMVSGLGNRQLREYSHQGRWEVLALQGKQVPTLLQDLEMHLEEELLLL